MDPYQVLGVEPTATSSQIRDAFRRAVRRQHPDTGQGDDSAGVRKVIDAYRLLMDPAARSRHDAHRRADGDFLSSDLTPPRPVQENSRCRRCSGRGNITGITACPECGGGGEITIVSLVRAGRIVCRRCRGTGRRLLTRPCSECGGSGSAPSRPEGG